MTQADRADAFSDFLTENAGLNPFSEGGHSTSKQALADRQRRPWQYEEEVAYDWMAALEVGEIPAAMIRRGAEIRDIRGPVSREVIESVLEGRVFNTLGGTPKLEKGVYHYTHEVIYTGDLGGGAGLYPVLDDGCDPMEPLNLRKVTRVVKWYVFDRDELVAWNSANTAEPEYYVLAWVANAIFSGKRIDIKPGMVIHRSRLWIHGGRPVSQREARLRLGWGRSVLDRNRHLREAVHRAREGMLDYMDRSSWVHVSFGQLNEILDEHDADGNLVGPDKVKERIKLLVNWIREYKILPTDAGNGATQTDTFAPVPSRPADKVQPVVQTSGDLGKVYDIVLKEWAMASELAASIALNEQATGLQGGANDGDWRKHQGVVDYRRAKFATPCVRWQCLVIFSATEGPSGGAPVHFELDWRELVALTKVEQAQLRKTVAETDKIQLDSEVAKVHEVRHQRIEKGDFFGPLTAQPDAVAPAGNADAKPMLVGIASMALQGAQAVREGLIPSAFYAAYLSSIDAKNFTPETVASLLNALEPEASEAAADGAESQAPKINPLDQLLGGSDPQELYTPKEIAAYLTKQSGLKIHTRAITDAIRRAQIQPVRVANKVGYNLAEVARALDPRDTDGDGQVDEFAQVSRADGAEDGEVAYLRAVGFIVVVASELDQNPAP